jgi:DNA-binding CsgD family transcriptional regulator
MARRGRPPADDVLTPAEWRTVEGVRHGLSNPEIARRSGISVDAVKYHVANALTKLGFERRATLRTWDGIRRRSALATGDRTMHSTPLTGALGQISRSVASLAAAEPWYRDVLGLAHLYTFGKLAFFDCAGVRLLLSEGDGAADSILYFRVDGIHASCEALTKRGVEFISAPHLIHTHADGTEEWMAFFKDNEGRPLALMAQAKPSG